MTESNWIAVTPGEPAGVGPELVVKLAHQALSACPLAISDPGLLERAAVRLNLPLELIRLDPELPLPPPQHQPGRLYCWPQSLARREICGSPHPENAQYVLNTLAAAVDLCLQQHCQAMVTAPVHKGVINQAGIPFTGHTEFLAERCGRNNVLMMLSDGRIRVALCTTHLPLAAVPAQITPERVATQLHLLGQGLRQQFGLVKPRIAVLGLNPHAGEGGHLGREELEIIQPAMTRMATQGMVLRGPLPADTAFTPNSLAHCDAILAMYHDQGLPALKAVGFGKVVNITLGLPIVRTSVDHGTALDIAGKNQADPNSLMLAYKLASEIAQNMSQHTGRGLTPRPPSPRPGNSR